MLAFGFILVVGTGLVAMWSEYSDIRDRFQSESDRVGQVLAQRIGSGEAVLTTLAGVYQASGSMSSTELTFLSQQILDRYSFISAIAQLPALLPADVAPFERSMRMQGFPQFQLTPYSLEEGHSDAVQDPTEYHLPVAFLEPLLPSNARFLGVDLTTHSGVAGAVSKAVSTGGVAAVPLDWLVPDGVGYVLVKATYFGHFAPDTEEERRNQLSGVFILSINLDHMLRDIGAQYPGMSIQLHRASPSGNLLLAGRKVSNTHPDSVDGLSPMSEQRPLTLEHGGLTALTGRNVHLGELNLGLVATVMLVAFVAAASLVHTVRYRRQSSLAQGEAERAVVRERDRAEVTLQSIGDAVVTTDNECRIRYLNPVAQRLTGWSEKDAAGRKVDEVVRLLHEETGETVTSASKIYDRPAEHGNYLLVSRQGRTIAVDHSASPLRDSGGGVIGGVLAIRDVAASASLPRN